MKIPAFITVRTGSTRLPKKCLMPFGEGNVLEHVIKRALYFDFDPIVCTTVLPEDDVIEKIAKKEGCKVFRGSVEDIPKRWEGACVKFGIKWFYAIDADDLFFEPHKSHPHKYIGDWKDTAEGYTSCLNHIRLTLDYKEDYWMLCTVLRCLGHFATGEEIVDLFHRNPDLHKINWFRQQDYKENQEQKSREINE